MKSGALATTLVILSVSGAAAAGSDAVVAHADPHLAAGDGVANHSFEQAHGVGRGAASMDAAGMGGGFVDSQTARLWLAQYSAPNFGGVDLGVSTEGASRGVPRLTPDAAAGFDEATDDDVVFGARFSQSFDEYSVSVSAGVSVDADEETVDPAFTAGAEFEFGGFELSGRLEVQNESGDDQATGFDRLSVGGTYATGAWLVGLSYDAEDAFDESLGEDTRTRRFLVGGEYAFGGNVTAGVSVEWGETSCPDADCESESSFGGGVLFGIVF